MKKCLFLIALLSNILASAQSSECGTRLTNRQKTLLADFQSLVNTRSRTTDTHLYQVGIVAHLIRRGDGSGGLSQSQLNSAIEVVNTFYANANMQFFIAEVNEILSDQYFNFNTADESAMGLKYDLNNVINIYFANSVGDNQGSYCGYAYFPGGPDRILMDNGCAINGSTLPHEIGHYFTLYHTHGKDNSQLTDELVNGTNCTTAGDELCDTPADPQLGFNSVNSSCAYTGTTKDANGDLFQPDPTNIMSYSRKECRDVFSDGQFGRIGAAYETYRSYLISKPVNADFTQNVTEVCAGIVVQYADRSIGAQSWSWYFEGGTPEISSEPHPSVFYESAGVYDVQLIVTGSSGGSDTLLMIDKITVTGAPESDQISTAADFETDADYTIVNQDERMTFERIDQVSTKGVYSMKMDFFNYESIGQEDFLVLSAIDNTFSTSYALSFDYAYAYYNAEYADGLAVVYKADCDTEWTTVWSAFGAGLATTSPKTSAFVPTASEWKEKSIAINLPNEVSVYQLALKTINGYGNNLYLDNVQLTSTFTVEVSQESCVGANDAAIAVNMNGAETYEYSIDGQTFLSTHEFTELANGAYTVVVRDSKGRSLSQVVELTEMALSIEQTDVTCYGAADGSVAFEVNGTDIYEFELNGTPLGNDSAQNLAAGTYEVLARKVANGCEYSEIFEISEPQELVVDIAVTDPLCHGDEGTLELMAQGGTGGYEVTVNGTSFNSTILNLGAGVHEVKVADSIGCEVSSTVTVSEPEPIELSYDLSQFTCEGDDGLLELQATGGSGELLFFVNETPINESSIIVNESGTYTITAEDERGCQQSEVIELQPEFPTPEVPVISQVGDKLRIDPTDFEVSWYYNGVLLAGEYTESINSRMGSYQVALANPGGACQVFSEEYVVFVLADDLYREIVVAPNPVGDRVNVKVPAVLDDESLAVEVFTLSGERIHVGNQLSFSAPWNLGVYLVRIHVKEHIVVRRILKN